ncbi:MAG: AgmX/PglI C-terminal domain-containing protein [Minicystis sp.]
MPPRLVARLAAPALLALAACSAQPATSPTDAAPAATAPLPTASAAPPPAASSAPAPPASAAASAEPAPAPTAAPAATAEASAPLPAVKVANIGMHIGGGPNDDVTKEPIRRSVQPHFDAFKKCFALVEDPKKAGDFGVDLRIDKAGGKAQVTHPRTALKGKEFKECVVKVFEEIDFLKPKGGTTTVSYSLRFTPVKDGK